MNLQDARCNNKDKYWHSLQLPYKILHIKNFKWSSTFPNKIVAMDGKYLFFSQTYTPERFIKILNLFNGLNIPAKRTTPHQKGNSQSYDWYRGQWPQHCHCGFSDWQKGQSQYYFSCPLPYIIIIITWCRNCHS